MLRKVTLLLNGDQGGMRGQNKSKTSRDTQGIIHGKVITAGEEGNIQKKRGLYLRKFRITKTW